MDSFFQDIYTKYHKDLFQFLFYLVKNRELTEDLIQEVYIRVLKSYEKFEGKSSLKTWLFSIAKNVAIDHFRKEKKVQGKVFNFFDWKNYELIDKHPLPEEIAIQSENMKRLYRSLDVCTIDQRTVIIARFINDLTIKETAEFLGWSESKVKTTQHRALKAIRKQLESVVAKEEQNNEAK